MSDKNTHCTGMCCKAHSGDEIPKMKVSSFCKTRVIQNSKSGIVLEPVCRADKVGEE